MIDKNYFRLCLKNVSPSEEELVSLWCFDHGAEGISENLPFRQNPEDYSVEYLPRQALQLEAYFFQPPSPRQMDEFRARFARVQVSLTEEQSADWLAEWKKGFVPFELVDEVWVVPRWCEKPAEAVHAIYMEPGMAFGTGTHETTRLAAKLLAKALASRPHARVLDVGTGTGILAVLARVLGAGEVVATDLDAEAVRVCQENLQLNGQAQIQVSTKALGEFEKAFDVVVANIIDGVLVAMQTDLKRLTAPGGALVLSGIIEERKIGFKERFQTAPLKLAEEEKLNEWWAYLLERSP